MPGSTGELMSTIDSTGKPVVMYADIYKKDTIVVTPRLTDGPTVMTFHYGKGKEVVAFKYVKEGKASERGGESCSGIDNSRDKKGRYIEASAAYEEFKEDKYAPTQVG